jgi:hypothetical protein
MKMVGAFVAVAAIAAPANAQERSEDQPYRPTMATITASPVALAIAGFDRDGDLEVSRSEYDEQVQRSFSRGDRDQDGSIGLIELSAWAETTLGNATALPGRFDFDRDGDDKISSGEFGSEFSRRFAELDKNKDSKLSRTELVTFVALPDGSLRRRERRLRSGEGEGSGRPLKPDRLRWKRGALPPQS